MKKSTNYGDYDLTSYDSTERFPRSVVAFSTDKQKSAIHPTQKPESLVEYFIKTYSNEGDLILDNAFSSGTTGVVCKKNNRKYIAFEKETDIYLTAVNKLRNLEK